MTIWTCKGAIAAFALVGLTACDVVPDLGALTGGQPDGALSQSQMAFGAVTLVPPAGFCIDRKSLKQTFALMTRCEALGAPQAGGGAPLGILIASFSDGADGMPSPEETATALDLDVVNAAETGQSSVTFRAIGDAPADGLSTTHWRGTAKVGTQVMGLAFYGPPDGRAISSEGRAILTDLIAGMQPNG